jgi:hypothetical protein
MVLEDSIEVMRGSTYEQAESEREDRGSKEKDQCPLTISRVCVRGYLSISLPSLSSPPFSSTPLFFPTLTPAHMYTPPLSVPLLGATL